MGVNPREYDPTELRSLAGIAEPEVRSTATVKKSLTAEESVRAQQFKELLALRTKKAADGLERPYLRYPTLTLDAGFFMIGSNFSHSSEGTLKRVLHFDITSNSGGSHQQFNIQSRARLVHYQSRSTPDRLKLATTVLVSCILLRWHRFREPYTTI